MLHLAIRQVSARPLLTGSMLLVLAPAGQALTLGDINVRSALGQRLDATVPVRLGPGEALASTCVVPGHQTSDLRSVPGADVTTPQATREGIYELRVTSPLALYEPMYELELKVQCPGAPVLIRQYVLMLDLPAAVASRTALAPEPAVAPAPPSTAQSATAGIENPAVQPSAKRHLFAASRPGETIETGARYRVVAGDSLSSIAARVKSRNVSLWVLASAIQAANPDAFIRGDANLIKLGSEILIPAATATTSQAETRSSAPEPMTAPVTAPVPAQVTPPVQATEPAAPAELMQAAQPEVARPQSPPAPVARPRHAPVPKPAAKSVEQAVDEPNPVVAAGAGILFGLCISALLWFRGRLPSRRRPADRLAPKGAVRSPSATTATARASTPIPAPLVTRSVEPGFSVSYTPPPDDALAAEFADEPEPAVIAPPATASRATRPAASEDITSELDELFDSTDTTIQKRLNIEKTMAARSLGAKSQDGYAPAVIEPGGTVDFLVGDPTDDDDATRRAQTVDQPRPDMGATSQSGTVDLHSLAGSATKDQQQAQTLLEALTLLERDYEEELTVSQMLDMSAVREALDNDPDEPTQIRDTHIREASARKKTR